MSNVLFRLHDVFRPMALGFLLFLIAAARVLQFDAIFLGHDEFWSIWQGYGGISDVLQWTPFDWPPLYYVVLDVWVGLVGIQSFALRYLSVLMFIIGAAYLYQVIRRNAGEISAWIGSLCFGGIAYLIFLSTELRGYSLMLMVVPMTWFFAQRLIDRPNWSSVLSLALTASACLYTSYVTIFPVIMIALHVLWQMRGRLREHAKFIFFAALFTMFLCFPIPFYLLPVQLRRVSATLRIGLPSFSEAIAGIYRFWFGEGALILTLLTVFGVTVLLVRRRITGFALVSFVWAFPIVPLFYLFNPYIGLFEVKYASWTLIGIAVFIGVSLGQLPRWGQFASLSLSALLLIQPTPWQPYNADLVSQLEVSLNWLQNHMHAGDQILLAEDHECTHSVEIWNYMLRANLPGGLSFTDTSHRQQRIWFVTADGSPDSPHWETLRRDYVERHFVGPPGCLFRLYEGPPDREGISFANGMRFHGAQFLRDGEALPPGFSPQLHEGEGFQVRLWWMVEEPLRQDYSVGVFLFDEGGRVIEEGHGAPDPSYPEGGPWETSRWQEGQIYYEDRGFEVPYPMERQRLELRLAVYYWEEPAQRFAAEGTDALGMLPLFQVDVVSW